MGIFDFIFGKKEKNVSNDHEQKKDKKKIKKKQNIYSTSVEDFAEPIDRSDAFLQHHASNIGDFGDLGDVEECSNDELNLSPEELDFLRYLQGKTPNSIAGYWTHEVNLKINKVIKKLLKYQYVVFKKDISTLTVSKLKELLKSKELKVSGRKNELIERIRENFSTEEIESLPISKTFLLTNKGISKIKDLPPSITHNYMFDEKCLQLIMKDEIEKAYRKVIDYERRKPAKRGLNTNWNDVENNLSTFLNHYGKDIMKIQKLKVLHSNTDNKLYLALWIYHIMLGKGHPNAYTIKSFIPNLDQSVSERDINDVCQKMEEYYSKFSYKPYKGFNNKLFEESYTQSMLGTIFELPGRVDKAI